MLVVSTPTPLYFHDGQTTDNIRVLIKVIETIDMDIRMLYLFTIFVSG
jgi:hypothetical protein